MYMEVKDRQNTIKDALIESFVNDRNAYKNTIAFINKDLSDANIDYQYSYDEFCVDFLNESLLGIESNDIFIYEKFHDFYTNFYEFNLVTLQNMLTKKLKNLGYSFEDVYKD